MDEVGMFLVGGGIVVGILWLRAFIATQRLRQYERRHSIHRPRQRPMMSAARPAAPPTPPASPRNARRDE